MKKRRLLKTATGWALTALMIAGLGGCATKKVPPIRYYSIETRTPNLEALVFPTPRFDTLEIVMVHPTRLSESSGIYYLDADHRRQPYAFSRWYETPATMLENKLLYAFKKAHVARTVVGKVSGVRAHYRLEIAILEAIQDFTDGKPSKVRLSCMATLLDNPSRESLAARLFETSVPAGSEDAKGGVEAFNRAADAIVTDILRWIGTVDTGPAAQR